MPHWTKERIQEIYIAPKICEYKLSVEKFTDEQKALVETHPGLFKFKALSIGDTHGQLCIIPLDNVDRDTAEFIVRALKAYKGD